MQNYLYESKIKIYQILKSLRDVGSTTRGWAGRRIPVGKYQAA